MPDIKELLLDESPYKLSDKELDRFLSLTTEIHLKNNEVLIPCGKVDPNIYIVKEGVIRYTFMNGDKELTPYLAAPGSIMVSYHCFCYGKPSFYQLEACCDCVILKVSKTDFDNLLRQSHDFALWILNMAHCQLYYFEVKNNVINGDAKERFISMVKNRREILQKVSAKTIASYLGITPSYLCRLKKQIIAHEKHKN
jgi:CRP-like cAMP-binding protein